MVEPGTRQTKNRRRKPAFLGRHPGKRLRCKRATPAQRLFPAASVLPGLRRPQGQRVQGQRQGQALHYVINTRPAAPLYAALRHRGGGARRSPRMMSNNHRLPADAGSARTRHGAGSRLREARRRHHPSAVSAGKGVAICAETRLPSSALPKPPSSASFQHVADPAARRRGAERHRRRRPETVRHRRHRHGGGDAQQIAHYLGITPTWVDGTSVGGCSFMLHVRHAAPRSRRSLQHRADHACRKRQVDDGKQPRSTPPDSLMASSKRRSASTGAEHVSIPVLRYMKTHGITHEEIAMVAVVQREWARRTRAPP